MTRISENMVFGALGRAVGAAQERAFTAQKVAASGRRVSEPSDDPVAFARATLLGGSRETLGAMGRAAERVRLELLAADQALGDGHTLIVRAREAAVAGANGSMTADERAVLATEVDRLRESLLAVANTSVGGVAIFAGYQTDGAAFAADGTYLGDQGRRSVEIAPNELVTVNLPGSDVFVPAAGEDVFGLLADLRDALRADDPVAVAATLPRLEQAAGQLSAGRSSLGLELAHFAPADARRAQLDEQLQIEQAALVEVDAAESLVELLQAQAAMQAAIAQATRILTGLAE